ncbi:hypothetical protein GS928_25035 [Rhodococcus hoagii]|nr:hypothetical protein [Prescottella equi]
MTTVVGLDPSLTAAGIAVIKHPQHVDTPNVPRLVCVGASGQNGDSLPRGASELQIQAERILRAMPPSVRLVVIEALPPKRH